MTYFYYKITIKNSGYKETDTPDEITYGDANLDDKVSISDAVSILQYIANGEKYPLSDKALRNADVDGNAGVSGKDAAEIQKYDAGVISIFPVQEK